MSAEYPGASRPKAEAIAADAGLQRSHDLGRGQVKAAGFLRRDTGPKSKAVELSAALLHGGSLVGQLEFTSSDLEGQRALPILGQARRDAKEILSVKKWNHEIGLLRVTTQEPIDTELKGLPDPQRPIGHGHLDAHVLGSLNGARGELR